MVRSHGGFYICNTGIAFGIEPSPKFWGVIILVIAVILLYQIFNFKFSIFKQFTINKYLNFQSLVLLLIISGAFSNIIDRVYFGCVIDFINLRFWPIFNLADIFITAGAILLLSQIIKRVPHNEK